MRYGMKPRMGFSRLGAKLPLMEATFTWELQGTSPTTIGALATDEIDFSGGTFGAKVVVAAYNDSCHVRTLPSTDKSSANTPRNNKFISATTADWGDGTETNTNIIDSEAALKVNFAHGSSVITENAIFFAYQQGAATTVPPVDVTFQAFESGDTNWINADGSGAALALADNGTSTSHDFFIAVSASPDAVGLKDSVGDFAIRMELDYS